MYQHFRRNQAVSPFGSPWPYYGQHSYQQYYGGGNQYHYNWNQYPPNTHKQFAPNAYPNFQPYGQQPPYSTPYPTGMGQMKQKGAGSILTQFKNKDGTYDINKMMDTAGQMVGAVNQVNSIVKGLTKTFKV
ncbi:YppG family protein [Bacillus sinesaloumensis]|uniref:YppG family protein n=1 Tax=Litchfieldia sinesaloumensis TaxID=1926280 RepID=UPI000988674F|nr:YppG family protein [Bacillus sinesaloumensis]